MLLQQVKVPQIHPTNRSHMKYTAYMEMLFKQHPRAQHHWATALNLVQNSTETAKSDFHGFHSSVTLYRFHTSQSHKLYNKGKIVSSNFMVSAV
ncbi:unnamed protein product [Heterobilharzia americana]|nr:unnamed protein product [Heterobilharzia americana]